MTCVSISFLQTNATDRNGTEYKNGGKLPDNQYNSELGIINLIRQGLFALHLLPENSSSGVYFIKKSVFDIYQSWKYRL